MRPAAARLVEEYLPLARSLAWEHVRRYRGADPDDVQSDAMLGLCQAAERFDPAKGAPFYAYARQRIRGAIADGRRDRDQASRLYRVEARRLEAAYYQFAAQHGRYPTEAELAEAVGSTVGRIAEVTVIYQRSRRVNMVDLDGAYEGLDAALPIAEVVPDPDADVQRDAIAASMRGIFSDYLPKLKPEWRMAIAFYYWDEMTLREIADVLGVTESRVSQILTAARERLAVLMAGVRSDLMAA